MFDSNPNDFFWAMHKAWHQKESTNKVKINKYKSTTPLYTSFRSCTKVFKEQIKIPWFYNRCNFIHSFPLYVQ